MGGPLLVTAAEISSYTNINHEDRQHKVVGQHHGLGEVSCGPGCGCLLLQIRHHGQLIGQADQGAQLVSAG